MAPKSNSLASKLLSAAFVLKSMGTAVAPSIQTAIIRHEGFGIVAKADTDVRPGDDAL